MDAVLGRLWTVDEQNVRTFALFAVEGVTNAFAVCTARFSTKQRTKYREAFLETIVGMCG
jgi:hypothetical protein